MIVTSGDGDEHALWLIVPEGGTYGNGTADTTSKTVTYKNGTGSTGT